MARLITALALLALPAAARLTVAAPAAQAVDTSKGTPGYCPDAGGVTIVIDFQELGGTTIVRCARGDQATGHAALKNAGIEIAGVARWGEAFICRIEGKPGANSEPCIDTPPASAYWSYWHAPNGGSWTYSQWGVMNRKPPPGSFEGWSFAKNKTETTNPPPRVAPSRPAAPATQDPPPRTNNPQPPAGNGGNPGSSGNGTTSAASGGNSGKTGGGSASTVGGSNGANGTSTSGTDPLAPGPGVSGNPMEAEPPPAAPASEVPGTAPTESAAPPGSAAPSAQPSGITPQGQTWTGGEELATKKREGIPTTTIAGIALLVAICAAAGFTTWRRRTRADGSG
ncbi:hypothetical protein [Embleya hyalina]|uniref:Flagellar hook-length control protein FliK n=1 Tax=Embleya hyalina TaxID=516124 RepID=A0A401YSV4_9ACTN|nr:hypothetical protein [Embleya hyalina]GCD97693.1 hypothetical protein EHYA_05389 [Embleya hyalina]